MAYNSDGYIMLDFTEVDFRRTNQTIEGLFKRCVDVIGTNKFILVINANGRTPLPATCSFTNNQYVIDTVIYMFAISSNDNLFIRRNDVPASEIINDSSISVDKTWSSNKIDSELDTKADTSALADYQLLLTAGDNVSIVDNVISVPIIKSFTYQGNGNTSNNIQFDTKPIIILSIAGKLGQYTYDTKNITFDKTKLVMQSTYNNNVGQAVIDCSYDDTTNILTLSGANASTALNNNGTKYTIYYI